MLPDGWRQCLISDIGEVQSGRQRSPHFTAGKLRPYLRVANVFDGYIDTSDVLQMYFSDSEFETFRLRNGDILLNEGQSLELVGRSAVYKGDPPDCCFQNTLIRFKPNADTFPDYAQHLFQFLLYTGRFAAIASRTTSIAHLGAGRFAGLSVRVPPFPEQKRISATLTAWDHAIELTEKLLAAKQQRKAALMQQLLMGKVRLPGFRDTHWEACELGEVASNSARRIGTTTPPPVYSVTNSVGMVPMDESVVGASIDRYKAVAKHDFAYNPMRINVGSIAMWDGDGEVLVSPDYVVFRCGPDLDPEFLNHYRTSHQWDQFVTKAGGGSVRVRIYFSDLAELPLKLPSVEEQKAIAAVLNTQDREIGLLQKKLDALRRQKKGLMQQLLTGRIRVRVESDSN